MLSGNGGRKHSNSSTSCGCERAKVCEAPTAAVGDVAVMATAAGNAAAELPLQQQHQRQVWEGACTRGGNGGSRRSSLRAAAEAAGWGHVCMQGGNGGQWKPVLAVAGASAAQVVGHTYR